MAGLVFCLRDKVAAGDKVVSNRGRDSVMGRLPRGYSSQKMEGKKNKIKNKKNKNDNVVELGFCYNSLFFNLGLS